MTQVLDETERQARRRRLVILLVVGAVIVGGLLGFKALRDRALDNKADAATSDLRSEWQSTDLVALSGAYSQATDEAFAENDGDYTAALKAFPTTDDADLADAQVRPSGAIRAVYSVEAWGGGRECLGVVASGPAPNRVTFVRSDQGC